MYYVNPFTNGISLKKDNCGVPCNHLQCKASVCDRALTKVNGYSKIVMNIKEQVLALIAVGAYLDAIELVTDLYNRGYVSFERFETFRIEHFSCQL